MHRFRRVNVLLLTVLLFVGQVYDLPVQAATKAKTAPAPLDRRTLITAVDLAKKKVTFEFMSTKGKGDFDLDDFTVITFHNEPGKITDLKVGQQVFAYVQRDSHTLDSISVDVADPAPVAGAK